MSTNDCKLESYRLSPHIFYQYTYHPSFTQLQEITKPVHYTFFLFTIPSSLTMYFRFTTLISQNI